jgi:hypothetical protein
LVLVARAGGLPLLAQLLRFSTQTAKRTARGRSNAAKNPNETLIPTQNIVIRESLRHSLLSRERATSERPILQVSPTKRSAAAMTATNCASQSYQKRFASAPLPLFLIILFVVAAAVGALRNAVNHSFDEVAHLSYIAQIQKTGDASPRLDRLILLDPVTFAACRRRPDRRPLAFVGRQTSSLKITPRSIFDNRTYRLRNPRQLEPFYSQRIDTYLSSCSSREHV